MEEESFPIVYHESKTPAWLFVAVLLIAGVFCYFFTEMSFSIFFVYGGIVTFVLVVLLALFYPNAELILDTTSLTYRNSSREMTVSWGEVVGILTVGARRRGAHFFIETEKGPTKIFNTKTLVSNKRRHSDVVQTLSILSNKKIEYGDPILRRGRRVGVESEKSRAEEKTS